MKNIVFSFLTLISGTCYAQNATKLSPSEQKLNDAICECLTKVDLSKVSNKDDVAFEFHSCISQNRILVVNLATERKVDLNDRQAMIALGDEVIKNLVRRECLAASRLLVKTSGAFDITYDKPVKHTGQDSVYALNIKRDAEQIVKAIFVGDFKTVLNYTYPEALKAVGGTEMMIETIKKGMAELKTQGATFKNAIVGEPGEFIKTQGKLFSIVPEEIFLNVNGKTFYGKSALLAISLDNGVNWYFIDGGRLSEEKIQTLFPETDHKLVMPKQSKPVLLD